MTDIDITPEAVERLSYILEGRGGFVKDVTVVATLRALSAALAASQAETATAFEAAAMVKPLDMSNMLKHAFMCGWDAAETTSSSREFNWTEYDPTESAAHARIMAALAAIPKGTS